MEDHVLRGEGIEIREITHEEDRRKYNIHIDRRLFVALMGSFEAMEHLKEGAPERKDSVWKINPDTGRRVFGYIATDEDFSAAAADTDCTG